MIKHFYRFLKENDAYHLFKQKYRGDYEDLYSFIKTSRINVLYYVLDVIDIYGELYNFWMDIDRKWMIYIYNNNLYGTPQTCRKIDIIEYIEDIFHDRNGIQNKEIVNEVIRILKNENSICLLELKKEEELKEAMV